MRMTCYVLDGHEVRGEPDMLTWGRWFESANRVVAGTKVGKALVSTVFLGLDHNWGDGPPIVFETLVFGGPHDGEEERYATWEEAERGHAVMVKRVRASQVET